MRLSIPGLSELLKDRRTTLVTSSTVLAAVATQQFARFELDRGSLSWHRPAIYSMDAWLTACWQEARYASPDTPSLLSTSQELLLWERVIADSGAELFDVSTTARLARDAFRLINEWRIPMSDERWALHEDAQQFARWHASFRKQCQTNGWMTLGETLRQLPPWLQSGTCATDRVLFAGFHAPSPSVSELLRQAGQTLDFTGNDFTDNDPKHRAHSVRMYADLRAQIDGAARWARGHLETNPTISLGIFLPNLADHRAEIERGFRAVFYPGSALRQLRPERQETEEQSAFHINRAESLYEHPLVANALLLLELARPRIETTAATAIVRSPFIRAAAEERGKRALADLGLRRLREMDVSLGDMEAATRQCPLLALTWKRVHDVLQTLPRQADASAWSKFFGDLVQSAGWPGDLELSAAEQQIVEAWKDSLSALATLGLVATPLTFDAALAKLRQILGGSGIQVGDWYSPVQILDSNDAAGLDFDAAFALGLSEESWPPPLRISPLAPLSLQRSFGVRNSTPESLREERLRLTEALFSTSRQVTGAFCERLSPLAAPYCKVVLQADQHSWNGKAPIDSFRSVILDGLDDTQAPRFDVGRDVAGGTGIIKAQSQCPFRAFAEYRLGSRSPEDASFGFDARDRGGFLHKTLQFVWQKLKDSETLKHHDDSELRSLIRECVNKAVHEAPHSEFHGQTTSVERERLEMLVHEWLNKVEKQRKQPFTVEQIETELDFDVAGLKLHLRVDRVDRLKNGQLLLIDYKSGKVTKNKLDCPRPPEPQLLIYASAKSPNVDGMLFGEVRAREPRLVGKTRDRHFAGSSAAVLGDEWDDFVTEAEAEVIRLAEEFAAGYALVDPSKEDCGFCPNEALCRVKENVSGLEEGA